MEKAVSMSGPLEMAVAMTTATVMAMPPACGPSPLTQPLMTGGQHCMMRAAPQPWPPPSVMDARGILRLEWYVFNEHVQMCVFLCVSVCVI